MTPVEGTTSTQVNVRAGPSTAGSVLGIIPADTKVQITGKDPSGSWWQILYEPGAEGKGWVTAQYVTAADAAQVPVVGDPDHANIAVVQQQLNVRSGPGTGFNTLGTLNPQDVVNLTGKDTNSTWLQIEYSSGPDGRGWVNAAFLQARGVENLPIVAESGATIGTGTPTSIPPTATPTLLPAWADNDSQSNPIANVIFDPLGTQSLIYHGDLSAPEGDAQDWIQFTPYTETVFASLECSGDSGVQVTVFENGQPTSLALACGDRWKEIAVQAGSVYELGLRAPQFSGGLKYFPYTVTIRTSP